MQKCIYDKLSVVNTQGIHVRPAAEIYLISKNYPDTRLSLSVRNKNAHGHSISEILALGASYQDKVDVKIEGPNAKKILRKLRRKFSCFDKYREESEPLNVYSHGRARF